eukprot:3847400-Amphidinium_carterae.2
MATHLTCAQNNIYIITEMNTDKIHQDPASFNNWCAKSQQKAHKNIIWAGGMEATPHPISRI